MDRTFVLTQHRTEGFVTWPRCYVRIVAAARFAIEHPLYTGRFRGYAYPRWWRYLSGAPEWTMRCD